MTNLTNTMKKLLSFSLIIMLALAFNSSKTYAQERGPGNGLSPNVVSQTILIKQQLLSLMVARAQRTDLSS